LQNRHLDGARGSHGHDVVVQSSHEDVTGHESGKSSFVKDALRPHDFVHGGLAIGCKTTEMPSKELDFFHRARLRELLKKLVALSPLQNAALVDFCEKFWRARNDLGFEEQCAALGLTVD